MLQRYSENIENIAGCDEAGRGCLCGPVVAAVVILPQEFFHKDLDDSKKTSQKTRDTLKPIIEKESIDFSVAFVKPKEIDKLNILKSSILAMHRALDALDIKPSLILVDGNRFDRYKKIKHKTVVKGDSKYLSIAAASILAKTHRDEYMMKIHREFPHYGWDKSKGYPTRKHREAILKYGFTKYHRKSFQVNISLF